MINVRERIDSYYKLGLDVERGFDEPGKVYSEHSHERTVLYTVAGSLMLLREGQDAVELRPGQEEVVESGQVHSAVVGPDGWKYVAAWDPKEAKEYETPPH